MKNFALLIGVALAVGCAAAPATQKGRSLLLKPQVCPGYLTQATVSVYDRTSIDHLVVKLYQPGTEIASLSIAQAHLDNPIRFTNLKPNTSYLIKAYAYLASGTLISYDDSSSWLSLITEIEDRPTLAALPIHLVDRSFVGLASSSLSILPGGYEVSDPEIMNHLSPWAGTLAGSSMGFSDGVGPTAQFNDLYSLTEHNGKLYVADTKNQRIREINPITR